MPKQRLDWPNTDEAHVWLWPLTQSWHAARELEEILSGGECQRLARFRFQQDARRFLVRRGILRQILGSYLARPPEDVRFAYGTQGKPALAGGLATRLQFNLSDSEELAVLAVTGGSPVGIDVEAMRTLPDAQKLAAHFFAPPEVALLADTPAEAQARRFFEIWTCKEAVLKAAGTGISGGLDGFALAEPANAPWLEWLAAESPAGAWRLHRLHLPEDFVGALACAPHIQRVRIRRYPDTILTSRASTTT